MTNPDIYEELQALVINKIDKQTTAFFLKPENLNRLGYALVSGDTEIEETIVRIEKIGKRVNELCLKFNYKRALRLAVLMRKYVQKLEINTTDN